VEDTRTRLDRAKAAAAVASDLMTVAVPPAATVAEAARRMHTAKVKRLPVVDRSGRPVGIVSRSDLLRCSTAPTRTSAARSSMT
jgi:CBS domain-containing protein